MENNCTYIDFDGVILDSEERMLCRKSEVGFINHNNSDEFIKYFEYTNTHPEEWDYILRNAVPINNSVEILQELEKMKKNISILTKIHTLLEMKMKVEIIRNEINLSCPIIFVPPNIAKHQVIIPNHQLLIDDSEKNIIKWNENGGVGYIFDSSLKNDEKNKVRSLEFLLKG